MNTPLIDRLYQKYRIAHLSYGTIHDKLGDVYEEFLTLVLQDPNNLVAFCTNHPLNTLEYRIFEKIMRIAGISPNNKLLSISATTTVPHRSSGGNAKTDVIATLHFGNSQNIVIPISSKQTTVAKVAMAEFDVDTICREMAITNTRLKQLLLKHQIDCSATNFTSAEKTELTALLRPIARDFVRWVITGSKFKNPSDVVFPTMIIKHHLNKPANRFNVDVSNGDFEHISFEVYTVEQYIDTIMYTKTGNIKSGGFGTGLSWTYATGSAGKKIQFKG